MTGRFSDASRNAEIRSKARNVFSTLPWITIGDRRQRGADALLGNEQHRQHHHGDVVVPRLPVGPDNRQGRTPPLASSKKRSTQSRWPCIWARRNVGVSGAALDKLYLSVVGEPTSRRTVRCRHRGSASTPSHTNTKRCTLSTRSGAHLLSRKLQRVHACSARPLTNASTVTWFASGL